jgi:hypothetical protein
MANTDVVLSDLSGVLVPSPDSVRVVTGDTVTFATADGSAAFAFFSPDTTSVLSPKPSNACSIAAGTKAHFAFTSSQSGSYSAFFGRSADDAPDGFPGGTSEMLALRINLSVEPPPPFSGPSDSLGTGHGG